MRYWLFAAVVFLGSACSHPLKITGKGDILSASGTRDCTYETFSAHTDPESDACPNVVVGHYFETYTAVPRPGWFFTGWTGCSSPSHQCTFNIDAETVDEAFGMVVPPLVAHFEQRYTFERIAYRILDAEYVKSEDLLVSLGDDDHLYLYDVVNHTTAKIDLGFPGSHLSVSPDGTRAVVAHNSYLSHIDLTLGSVIEVYPFARFLHDIELDDRGFVHIMENTDRHRMKTLNLATGEVVDSDRDRYPLYMDIHLSGDFIYGVSTYSNSIEKYNISGGTAQYGEWTTTASGHSHCNDLWLSEDGQNMFTACGSVYFTSDLPEIDMTLNTALYVPEPAHSYPKQRIAHLSHSGNEVLFVTSELSDRVEVHQYNPAVYLGHRSLPEVTVAGQEFATHGRFIFHTSSGDYIVIAEIDESAELDYPFGIVRELPLAPDINVRPSAITDGIQYADLGAVTMDGSRSFDPEGEALSYNWQLLSAPAGSSAFLLSNTDSQAQFTADLTGTYLFSLVVNDSSQDSETAMLEVVVEDPNDRYTLPLNFILKDAEYSTTLDRLIMVADMPSRVIQFDLATKTFQTSLLPFPAETVGVSPDGLYAAIGHSADQRVSLMSLETGDVAVTYYSTTDIGDLVLAGNGFLYMFPLTGQSTSIYNLNIFTGQVTQSGYTRERTKVDIHPSGDFIYGADNGVSPDDIEVYDIRAGLATYMDDSPYHGDYEFCGDIWVKQSGGHLFTRCGNIYNAIPGTQEDMTFAGWLNTPDRVTSLSDHGDEVALVTDPVSWDLARATRLRLFNFSTRKHQRDIALPTFNVDGSDYSGYGTHAFHDSSGNVLLVLVRADGDAGLLFNSQLYVHGR